MNISFVDSTHVPHHLLPSTGVYTERVLEAVQTLRDHVMPNFAEKVEMAVEALSSEPARETDENEFIDASRLVYDGVRDIRRAVLMNREPDDIADESDLEDEFDKSSMYSTNTNTGQWKRKQFLKEL